MSGDGKQRTSFDALSFSGFGRGHVDGARTIDFVIPGHPPSTNNLFMSVGRRRVKSKEYRLWEKLVSMIVLFHPMKRSFKELDGRVFSLNIVIVKDKWCNKTGSLKGCDTPNYIKALEDSICAVTGWKDNYNFDTRIRKVEDQGAEDCTMARFTFL